MPSDLPPPASLPPAIVAAVQRQIQRHARLYPSYAGDVAGAAWVRVLERRARGQADTPEHAAVVARCGISDFVRAERNRSSHELDTPDFNPQAPAQGPDFDALRDAFARLRADDRTTLVTAALYGATPRRAPPGAPPAVTRSSTAWRRHRDALARARALWASP